MEKSKRNLLLLLLALCLLAASSACADLAPAVQKVGKQASAEHLSTHIGAFTDGIVDKVAMYNRDDEHIFCTGSRVSMWDTPQKGSNVGDLYPGSKIGMLEKNSEFELIDIQMYRNKYYANVRVYKDGAVAVTGWVSADYIGCGCKDYSEREEVEEWEPISLSYHLR